MYRLAVAAMLVVPVSAMAQTSSINAFSPYSMYGIGELQTPGVVAQRSMGGVGLGMRSSVMVNPLNPAAYSLTPRQGFLFDFGVEGVNFYNRQQKYADGAQTTSRTSYNTFNFHDIAFQLPLARRLGLGFSLTPYSSVGYRVSADEQSDDVWGNIGRVQYLYAGEGDLTEVKLGIGWEVVKRVSIGVAAQYYWGDIERTYQTVVSNNIVNGGSVNTATFRVPSSFFVSLSSFLVSSFFVVSSFLSELPQATIPAAIDTARRRAANFFIFFIMFLPLTYL